MAKFEEGEFEEFLHGLSLEELSRMLRQIETYFSKLYGFSVEARRLRTPEWMAKAAVRYDGQVSTCCECCEDYPKGEHQVYGHVLCASCRSLPGNEWDTKSD
jgi:hypothetical protein